MMRKLLLVGAVFVTTQLLAEETEEVFSKGLSSDSLPQEASVNRLETDPDFGGDPPFLLEEGWVSMLNGQDLTGWQTSKPERENEWVTTQAVRFDAVDHPDILMPSEEAGDRIVNGTDGNTVDLVSDYQHGDIEFYAEFMMSEEPNASGIYFHGLYELQIYGSWNDEPLKTSDCGGIYHHWVDGQPVGGSPPRVNACRAPGQWQSFHVWFRAPRFDKNGQKTSNATFEKVLLNGVLVQENVEVDGGTRSHMPIPEASTNPLLLQGNHKSIAFKNIYYKPLE